MNRVLVNIHILQSAIGVLFALFIAYIAIGNVDDKSLLAYGRFVLALILFLFSITHVLFVQKRAGVLQVISFLPIYIFFGLSFSMYLSGYIKNWAPATEPDALMANIKGCFLLLSIFSLGVISAIFKSNKQNT